jgi:glucokinase
MTEAILSVGVDVGGTNIKFGLVDETGSVLFRTRTATNVSGGSEAIISDVAEGIRALLQETAVPVECLRSIGIGIPGTTDSNAGVVTFAANLFWKDIEIVKAVRKFFGAPIFAAQDTRAAAWAEHLVGAGRGLHSLAAVTLGTGIGCGMVFDGRIFHGALNSAGEIGHQIVEVDGIPCNCGRHGCLEAYAAGPAILREAVATIPGIGDLLHKAPSSLEVQDIYSLAQEGNQAAHRITEKVVRYIGIGLVNLININSLELITLSGGISNAPRELLLDPLVEFVRNRVYQCISTKVCICRSPLGEDAPLIGAALLFKEQGLRGFAGGASAS